MGKKMALSQKSEEIKAKGNRFTQVELNAIDTKRVEFFRGRANSFMLLGTYNETFSGMRGFYQEFFYDYDYAIEMTKAFLKNGFFTQIILYDEGWLMWLSHTSFWYMDNRLQSFVTGDQAR